jgi:hypothetical protein
VKNANLYDNLKEFCKAATTLFKKRMEKADLPLKDAVRLTEFGSTAFLTETVRKVDWFHVVFAIEKELAQLDAYQQALQTMIDDQMIAKHLNSLVGGPGAGRKVDGPEHLRWFITQLLEEQQGFDFQENVFQKNYEGFEDFFYRDTFEYRAICPLHNFKMNAEKVALSPTFSIIKFSKEDKERMLTNYGQPGSIGHLSINNEFALEIYVEAPKVIGGLPGYLTNDPVGVARRAFDEVCDALRLFKNGAVHYGENWIEPTSWNVTGVQSAWPGWGAPGRLNGPIYSLLDDEVSKFLEFRKSCLKDRMEKHESIMIAVNRLHFGYERLRPEDRLIDFMIGLEALFLSGLKNELRYRLSLRAAALLGDSPENRENIFNDLYIAYDQRSIVAHGDSRDKNIKIGGNKIPFEELVNRVEDHLRSAIKEFLVRCENDGIKQLLINLDLAIVRGISTTN